MTFIRQDAWALSEHEVWPDALLWYARGVQAMQSKPISDVTSWQYQAAVHGLANTTPPAGAPWNECQHATWYFAPWHRMYLFQFEKIVRAAIVALKGPTDWALPYWNYERSPQTKVIPPAFTAATLPGPDKLANPLWMANRRPAVNAGVGMPAAVASSEVAMSDDHFVSPDGGEAGGFGGPVTGFAHFGPSAGDLENQPHNVVHGWVGGLMNNPDTAAQDPIFWLHHANIDRLWETWRIQTNANPTDGKWRDRKFKLRDEAGALIEMKVSKVVTTDSLGYTYDALPAAAGVAEEPAPMPARSPSQTFALSTETLQLGRDGASAVLDVGPLPPAPAGAAVGEEPRYYVRLADITGESNPDVIYGVYVNLPDNADDDTKAHHRVGLVSFFGIEHSTSAGSKDPQPLAYSFDATRLLAGDAAKGTIDKLHVSLLPLEETLDDDAAAAVHPPIQVGTVAVSVAQ